MAWKIFDVSNIMFDSMLWANSIAFTPNWHDLWKKEKCSSLAPPMGMFYVLLDSMSFTGCQINPIDVNFHLQKCLIKIQLIKSDQKGQGDKNITPHANKG